MSEPREKPAAGASGPEGAQPAEADGDTPRDCHPRAAAGDWGGFGSETQGTGGPEGGSAFLGALVRSARAALAQAREHVEDVRVAAEARLVEVERLIVEMTDAKAAAGGTELGAAVRAVVSEVMTVADATRARFAEVAHLLDQAEAEIAEIVRGGSNG